MAQRTRARVCAPLTRALARSPALRACRYTACTLVKIQSEHESAMGTFIVHSYVVLSALHYAIVFSTRPLPPPPALLLIMRITIISLCGRSLDGRWMGGWGEGGVGEYRRGFDIYTFSVGFVR
jgi:hypothetical protein